MHGQKWREGIMQRVQKDMVMGDKALSVKDSVPYLKKAFRASSIMPRLSSVRT